MPPDRGNKLANVTIIFGKSNLSEEIPFAYLCTVAGMKTYVDESLGEVTFRKVIRCRSISIRVRPDRHGGAKVTVTLPFFTSYARALDFFLSRREDVVLAAGRYSNPEVDDGYIEDLRRRAREYLPERTRSLAMRYGFTELNRVCVKHNLSNWGSCSRLRNVNLNLNLMCLPYPVADYVILHELCHLRHMNHGPEFHALLEDLCRDNMERIAREDPSALAFPLGKSRSRYPVSGMLSAFLKKEKLI